MVADVDARSSTAAEGRVKPLYSPGNPISMVSPLKTDGQQSRFAADV